MLLKRLKQERFNDVTGEDGILLTRKAFHVLHETIYNEDLQNRWVFLPTHSDFRSKDAGPCFCNVYFSLRPKLTVQTSCASETLIFPVKTSEPYKKVKGFCNNSSWYIRQKFS